MTKRVSTQIPMPPSGGPLRKLVGIATVIALLVIVIKHPAEAAAAATRMGGVLGDVIDGLWSFVQQLG